MTTEAIQSEVEETEPPKTSAELLADMNVAREAYDAAVAVVRQIEHRIATNVEIRVDSPYFEASELKPLVEEYRAAVAERYRLLSEMSNRTRAMLEALGDELTAQQVRREALAEERAALPRWRRWGGI